MGSIAKETVPDKQAGGSANVMGFRVVQHRSRWECSRRSLAQVPFAGWRRPCKRKLPTWPWLTRRLTSRHSGYETWLHRWGRLAVPESRRASYRPSTQCRGHRPACAAPDYDAINVSQQLLVLSNLERVDRSLPGFTGLSLRLDASAQAGASSNSDPVGPLGTAWGSNWAGGETSALLADFDWMYDDGVGSPNLDCNNSSALGCWDHRRNILADYGPHPAMGSAATKVDGVTSMTELFSSAASTAATSVLSGRMASS